MRKSEEASVAVAECERVGAAECERVGAEVMVIEVSGG